MLAGMALFRHPRPAGLGRSMLVLLMAGLIAGALLTPPAASAASAHQRLERKRSQLDQTQGRVGVLTTTIERYSKQIAGLEEQVASLRAQEAAAENRLIIEQAKLRAAQTRLKTGKQHLALLRARLRRALVALREHLVSTYESGSPDVLTVILQSDGWDDLVSRAQYLQTIQDEEQSVVGRVRSLKEEARRAVNRLRNTRDTIRRARDEIAAQRDALSNARASLEGRQAELIATRGQRQRALSDTRSHEHILEGDVSDLQAQIRKQLTAQTSTPLPAGPLVPSGGATSTGLVWPVQGTITSGFGMRWGRMHEGLDIAAPTGTPIVAAQSGIVTIAAYTGGYGNYTCIDHGGGLSTCYGHQVSFATSAGAAVKRGELIGYVGSTGESTGPHLHFEVRVNGVAQDPLGYL